MRNLFCAAALAMVAATLPAFAQTAINAPTADGGQAALRVFEAKGGAKCAPTVIISRGLGARVDAMRFLSGALVAQGYRVIVMRHLESGRAVFQGRLVRAGRLRPTTGDEADLASNKERALELDAAYAFATKTCRPPLMALAGHANGAITTLIEAGAKPRFAVTGKDRFDAYVALSPPSVGRAFAADAWSGIKKPVLFVTGTRDPGESGARTAAFEGAASTQKRLAVIPNATHFALGGLGASSTKRKVVELTLEFLGQVGGKAWKPSAVAGVDVRDKP